MDFGFLGSLNAQSNLLALDLNDRNFDMVVNSECGFGSGSSILIFCGMLGSIPSDIRSIFMMLSSGTSVVNVLSFIFLLGLLLVGIVLSQEAVRKVETVFVRSSGRTVSSKSSSFIPFKLINSGIMPIIFASAALQLPALVS